MKVLLPVLLACLLFQSCTVKKNINTQQHIENYFNSETINDHHLGFILKDLKTGKIVFEKNADQNFIAASNIKLLTFYTGLNMLEDSVPSFKYQIEKDSLFIWPMADPTFLHPDFRKQNSFDFLKNSGKNIYIINGNYKGEKFGKGWSWDDYNESFQAEITEFPIYGNIIKAKVDSTGKLNLFPDLLSLYYSESSFSSTNKSIKRNLYNNNITIPQELKVGFSQKIPVTFNKNIYESLLTDTLLATGLMTSSVNTLKWKNPPQNAKIVYSNSTEDTYKKMLQESDNFIAEQLLLNFGAAHNLDFKSEKIIEYALNTYLPEIKNKIQWVDGSGLSRLNLLSPKSLLIVLEKIRLKINNDEKLFSLLPTGGRNGTLKNMFNSIEMPFVHAKSGSLTNNYNLSGYLVTKIGNTFAFSYLNNNFLKPQTEIKAEIEKLLQLIYNNY
jgi:D-alanyl-D-alanine carboxypeptidase/D-alanyl-D-alanine-endopeptidase (penicillin-binding protein 4)